MKQAICILVKNELGQILAVSRKDNFNDFGLPGGKVDDGETEQQAAIRELKEETGLDIVNLKKIFQDSAEGKYLTSCWIGDVSGEIHTTEKGIVKWVQPEIICQGCFGEYNIKLFSYLNNIN